MHLKIQKSVEKISKLGTPPKRTSTHKTSKVKQLWIDDLKDELESLVVLNTRRCSERFIQTSQVLRQTF